MTTGRRKPGRSSRFSACLAGLLAGLLLLAGPASLTGCRRSRVLGEIDDQASVALVRYEVIDQDLSGIVYREVLDLATFLAETKIPVLLIFHQSGDAVERQLIPLFEQFADDYKDKVAVVSIDARTKPSLVSLYGVETLPQYILIQSGTARLTMSGFDETTRSGLEQMVERLS